MKVVDILFFQRCKMPVCETRVFFFHLCMIAVFSLLTDSSQILKGDLFRLDFCRVALPDSQVRITLINLVLLLGAAPLTPLLHALLIGCPS